jgi:peptidase MA superfamily protein
VRGWELGEARLPLRLGLWLSGDPLSLYLFTDQDEFRRQTSQLTGLPLESIGRFEGGRSYARGARRGIYLDGAALSSAAQAAHLVTHELAHLAERDALGANRLPLWLSEGLAEYLGQDAMAGVDATAAAQRRWRRAAIVASAIHQGRGLSLAALSTTQQWNEAAQAGVDRLLYAQALLTVDWLVERSGDAVLARLTAAVRDGQSYAGALESTTGFTPSALDERVGTALRQSLPPRFPVGVHVTPSEGPPGTRFQFAAVGLPPGEVLAKRFVREDGEAARSHGPPSTVSPVGTAFWSFQSRPDGMPNTWSLAVEGDRGTSTTATFRVVDLTAAPGQP